ncbi:hypothetical protein RJ639_010625 [Escallonia herrerae]|uniref:Uncharacterized protein n=1 Tax=Escallonia herrerae TaxID=1293975 RepID=A0AA89ARP8_9ASTE|nr:hypothetical protein RJ639_010625 [Escallonia herrerae]
MGTPEFPNLGKHCSVGDCKLIDFLPFTCDCCHQIVKKRIEEIFGVEVRDVKERAYYSFGGTEFVGNGEHKYFTYLTKQHRWLGYSDVFCLEHRSYIKHQCPKGNKHDVTVVICPLCAKGVHLVPDEDPNVTWESHVNTECDPSNYEKATKKKKCPVPGCRESLTFSNTIRCRDCTVEHCLKHRFGADHKCPGPKRPDTSFQFMGFLSRSRKEESKSNKATAITSPNWASSFAKVASSVRASAEAGMTKLSNEFSQAMQTSTQSSSSSSGSHNGSSSGQVEQCPQCHVKFASVTALVDHVQKVHERNSPGTGVMKVTIDVCPKCSKGFRDPVALVEHVERDHRGTSKA